MSCRRFTALSILLPALGLAACATAPVYQPASGRTALGYQDQRIEANRYRISYRAQTPEAANDFALRRAAEITVNDGADWFEVISRDTDRNATSRSGSRVSIGGATGSGGGVSLGGGIGFGLGSASTGQSYVSIEIITGAGPIPSRPGVYNARGVLQNLGTG